MSQFPSLEVLEKTHRFPTRFLFKAIGKADETFVERVLAAARLGLGEGVGTPQSPTHTVREAEGGRHLAVTLEIVAHSAQQILDVYKSLMTVPGLLMLL